MITLWNKIVCVAVLFSGLFHCVHCQLYYVNSKGPALPASGNYPGSGPENVNFQFETSHTMQQNGDNGRDNYNNVGREERSSDGPMSQNMQMMFTKQVDFDDQLEQTKPTYFEPPMGGTKTPNRPMQLSPQQMNDYRPIKLPIFRRHFVQFNTIPAPMSNVPATTVEIGSSPTPLNILFRSSSTPLNIQQLHEGALGSFKKTESTGKLTNILTTIQCN